MLPLLVDADVPEEAVKAGNFYPYIAGLLRSALNEDRRVTFALATALLRSGRVLVIVDGLSELSSTASLKDRWRVAEPSIHRDRISRFVAWL